MYTIYFLCILSMMFISFLYHYLKLVEVPTKKTLLSSVFQLGILSFLFYGVFSHKIELMDFFFLIALFFFIVIGTKQTQQKKILLLLLKSKLIFLISIIFVLTLYEWLFKMNIYALSPVSIHTIILLFLSFCLYLFLEWQFSYYVHRELFDYLFTQLSPFFPLSIILLLIGKNVSLLYILLFSKHAWLISVLFFLSTLLEIFFGMFLVIAIVKTYHLSIQKYKNIILHMQSDLQVANLKQIEDHQTQIRRLSHDLHNHKNVLYDFIRHKHYPEALTYLENIGTELQSIEKNHFTNHKLINAILNYKLEICNQDSIPLQLDIQFPEKLSILDFDLCILVGNLLDNSIEASRKLPQAERFIEVKGKILNENLIFEVKNHYNGKLHIKGERFLTDKKEVLLHGLGLQNVQVTVQKYDGSHHIDYNEKSFSVLIRIPLHTEKGQRSS